MIIFVECLEQRLTHSTMYLLLLSQIGDMRKFILQTVTEAFFGNWLGERGGIRVGRDFSFLYSLFPRNCLWWAALSLDQSLIRKLDSEENGSSRLECLLRPAEERFPKGKGRGGREIVWGDRRGADGFHFGC